jgi:hypothetical protein
MRRSQWPRTYLKQFFAGNAEYLGPCSSSGLLFRIKLDYLDAPKIFFIKGGGAQSYAQTYLGVQRSRNMFMLTVIAVKCLCEPPCCGAYIVQNGGVHARTGSVA